MHIYTTLALDCKLGMKITHLIRILYVGKLTVSYIH